GVGKGAGGMSRWWATAGIGVHCESVSKSTIVRKKIAKIANAQRRIKTGRASRRPQGRLAKQAEGRAARERERHRPSRRAGQALRWPRRRPRRPQGQAEARHRW